MGRYFVTNRILPGRYRVKGIVPSFIFKAFTKKVLWRKPVRDSIG
jgi:hypothetical protein